MNTQLNLLFIILLLSIFPTALSVCPSSICANSGPIVRFPFQLLFKQQPNTSYPGFNLSCNTQALTVLTLPNSGDFFVSRIDYYNQQITLSDPQNCIPKRLMNLNLSNSPFDINYYYRNYTFLSCPTHLVQSRYTTIDCLSNSTTSVLATTSLTLAQSISNSCTIIKTVPIPIPWPYLNYQNGFTSHLMDDFHLSWNITGCISCEGAGGFCALKDSAGPGLGCYQNCQSGPSPSEIRLFRLVILCFTIPAVSFTISIAMYFWFLDQRRRHLDWEQSHAATTFVHPATTPTPNGLDEVTIESYSKIIVGESKRIPGPNDIACPICLVDYCPKDTLRSIPECRHCFHAECVDEWLRSNPTCPVCRNSPSRA
ncbi:unnamed protein product [Rhodiola kirilowii]